MRLGEFPNPPCKVMPQWELCPVTSYDTAKDTIAADPTCMYRMLSRGAWSTWESRNGDAVRHGDYIGAWENSDSGVGMLLSVIHTIPHRRIIRAVLACSKFPRPYEVRDWTNKAEGADLIGPAQSALSDTIKVVSRRPGMSAEQGALDLLLGAMVRKTKKGRHKSLENWIILNGDFLDVDTIHAHIWTEAVFKGITIGYNRG